jgi:hypothetical protein
MATELRTALSRMVQGRVAGKVSREIANTACYAIAGAAKAL